MTCKFLVMIRENNMRADSVGRLRSVPSTCAAAVAAKLHAFLRICSRGLLPDATVWFATSF